MNLQIQQKVILLQDGIQLWMSVDQADALLAVLKVAKYDDSIDFDGRNFTKSMYRGTFLPGDIEEQTKRKNGDWVCRSKKWHHRGEQCDCTSMEQVDLVKRRDEAVVACGKCSNGYVMLTDANDVPIARECECVALIHTYPLTT